jgi:hypothetical protein
MTRYSVVAFAAFIAMLVAGFLVLFTTKDFRDLVAVIGIAGGVGGLIIGFVTWPRTRA